ncbi:MAG TPA: hypothetical protein VGQ99_12675 [Tepidisphaeraceae bacterium]|jgi:hypothetical protein|nr:hypothetical protein [Tepidisphaeraceae bacterium]
MRRYLPGFILILLAGAILRAADTSALTPLTELGNREYKGFAGGLYPDAKNQRPDAHDRTGILLATQIKPLDPQGLHSEEGKIVLLSIGMSNTTQEFSAFMRLAQTDRQKNPRLILVDGAQGGMTAARISNPDEAAGSRYWATVDDRLKAANATRAQVQVAWIKQADAQPTAAFPRHAQILEEELQKIVHLLHTRFPNLKIVYLSSRIYAGYAKSRLNPEPFAYESAFSVRWLIEKQLKGDKDLNFDPAAGEVKAPWLSWGPYLWANGTTKRDDGLTYDERDFGNDGTHPSQSGREKVARQLLDFFKSDSTARPWFLRPETKID